MGQEYKLPYQLLNAKPENVRRESEIVAQAGKKNTITIATNMAGRGTDIILGGNIDFQIQKELYDILTLSRNYTLLKKKDTFKSTLKMQFYGNSQKFLSVLSSLLTDRNFLKLSDIDILRLLRENNNLTFTPVFYKSSIKFLINELNSYYEKHQRQENKIIKNLGGLCIIGTEKNESRRVDNQLRGRCGRQGDPGTSQFFLSLDDNLLRLFGGSKIQTFLQAQMLDDLPLEANILTRSLDSAQQKVEERAYQQRKNLFDYDEILNKQRKVIYLERTGILNKESLQKNILAYGEQMITNILLKVKLENSSTKQIISLFENLFGKNLIINSKANPIGFQQYLFNEFWLIYQAKINELNVHGDGICESLERNISLINIDIIWREHLQEMSLLREAVSWRGYGQQNPLYEYKKDALKFFNQQSAILRQLVIYELLRSSIL